MKRPESATVVLPAYGDPAAIGPIVRDLAVAAYALRARGIDLDVLLLHDRDEETAALAAATAAELGMALTTMPGPHAGPGAAYLAGFRHVVEERRADLVVTLDANGRHDGTQIPRLIDQLVDEDLHVIIGSRWARGSGTPGLGLGRWLLGRLANRTFRVLTGTRAIADATTSFRVARIEVVRDFDSGADPGQQPQRPDRVRGHGGRPRLPGRRGADHLPAAGGRRWRVAGPGRQGLRRPPAGAAPPGRPRPPAAPVALGAVVHRRPLRSGPGPGAARDGQALLRLGARRVPPVPAGAGPGGGRRASAPSPASCSTAIPTSTSSAWSRPRTCSTSSAPTPPWRRGSSPTARRWPSTRSTRRSASTPSLYLNVLEHIADDAAELGWPRPPCGPGGAVLVFGPALEWLYSELDYRAGHYRRYSLRRLRAPGRGGRARGGVGPLLRRARGAAVPGSSTGSCATTTSPAPPCGPTTGWRCRSAGWSSGPCPRPPLGKNVVLVARKP